jgi:hypothetical protein
MSFSFVTKVSVSNTSAASEEVDVVGGASKASVHKAEAKL